MRTLHLDDDAAGRDVAVPTAGDRHHAAVVLDDLVLRWRAHRGRVHRSAPYVSWLKHAGWELVLQKPARVTGQVRITIAAGRPDRRRRDADNCIKATLVPPCCPVSAKAVPVGDGWLHEVKFDGYRVQIHKTGNDVTIYSRNGHVFTPRFETIAYLLRDLPAQSAVLDGEIVASDRRDVPNFARLHLRSGSADGLHLWCFDLLALNGRGWRHQPLEKRQDRLQGLIQRFDCPPVKASEPFTEGVKLLQVAERMKLESVVSKRRGTAYRLGQDDRLAHGEPRAWRMFERA